MTVMSPIQIVRSKGAPPPASFGGVMTGRGEVMPWERPGNVLDKYVLPGTEALTPQAIKARGKRVIGATLGGGPGAASGGGGGGGSMGMGGGSGGVSYTPGGSPIGKALPKAWSGPQGTFEAAKAKGEVTPEKIAQAQAFAAANGRVFDPALGYSTNKQPAAPAATMPGSLTPTLASSTPAASSTKPAVAATFDPSPHVMDGGKPVLTQAAKERGITGWDENGAPIYGFADGTPPGGVPLQALEGQPFWTGEQGPELQQIKDGKLTVIPTAPMVSPTFAPSAGPMLRTAPSPERVVATPGVAMSAFAGAGGAMAPGAGFTPASSPTFAPTLSAPAGVRQTDFRRFLRTQQGLQFALGREAQQQGMAMQSQTMAAHNQNRAAAMNTERQWQMEDKNAAKQQKAEDEMRQGAAYDQLFGALTTDKAALPPVFRDLLSSAKDVKSKAALTDLVLGYLGTQATSDQVLRRQEEAAKRNSATGAELVTDPTGKFGVPMVKHADGTMSAAGGAMSLSKPVDEMSHEELLAFVKSGGTATRKVGSATLRYEPPKAAKPAGAPTVREIRRPGAPGQPDQIDYQQWYPEQGGWGPMTQLPGSNAPGGARPSAFLGRLGQ